jgi:hypothetical protein
LFHNGRKDNMKTAPHLIIAAFALAAFNLSAATLYVSLESRNPVVPYATWATAATNIQDAVDAARDGDTVLVTNGVYAVGSRDMFAMNTNSVPPRIESVGLSRVVVTNSIRLESVNGPLAAIIDGGTTGDGEGNPTNGVRCVFLGTNAMLSGFTLTNGWAYVEGAGKGGGGVWCTSTMAVLTNCTLIGNRASGGSNSDSEGGGAHGGTLYNCTLTDNSFTRAWGVGGGAYACLLYNCTLSDNVAYEGGGACSSRLYNCLVKGNSLLGLMQRGGGVRGYFICRD